MYVSNCIAYTNISHLFKSFHPYYLSIFISITSLYTSFKGYRSMQFFTDDINKIKKEDNEVNKDILCYSQV